MVTLLNVIFNPFILLAHFKSFNGIVNDHEVLDVISSLSKNGNVTSCVRRQLLVLTIRFYSLYIQRGKIKYTLHEVNDMYTIVPYSEQL